MSALTIVVIPADWHTAVPTVLAAAGFEVTQSERRYPYGPPVREYSLTREGMTVSFEEWPDPDDPSQLVLFGYARRKESASAGAGRTADGERFRSLPGAGDGGIVRS